MKLVLVLELLSLSFIVRYVCAASDPNPNYRLPDSETSSSSISLRPEEEISNTNPISATTTKDAAANFQRGGEHSPDHHPFDMGESLLELHSQSKGEGEGEGDPCLSDDDKNQAPNSRRGRRLRRQFCSSSYIISPYRTTGGETPVTLPPIPAWGNVDLNIPTNQVTSSDGIREDPKLCADDWQNMPVCAPESSVIGDYLPECRPRTFP